MVTAVAKPGKSDLERERIPIRREAGVLRPTLWFSVELEVSRMVFTEKKLRRERQQVRKISPQKRVNLGYYQGRFRSI